MKEGDNGYAELEFWEGHSFEDNCQPIEAKQEEDQLPFSLPVIGSIITLTDGVRSLHQELKEVRRVDEKIRLFLATKGDLPIKRLIKGDIFDSKDYPKGTTVRFQNTGKTTLSGNRDSLNWGVITQIKRRGKFEDILMYADSKFIGITGRSTPRLFYHSLSSSIDVGSVKHLVSKDRSHQSFDRYDFFEIWQYGTEARETSQEDVPSSSMFSPERLDG